MIYPVEAEIKHLIELRDKKIILSPALFPRCLSLYKKGFLVENEQTRELVLSDIMERICNLYLTMSLPESEWYFQDSDKAHSVWWGVSKDLMGINYSKKHFTFDANNTLCGRKVNLGGDFTFLPSTDDFPTVVTCRTCRNKLITMGIL